MTTEEYPSKVKRPAYSVLDKTKIKETFEFGDPIERSIKKLHGNFLTCIFAGVFRKR